MPFVFAYWRYSARDHTKRAMSCCCCCCDVWARFREKQNTTEQKTISTCVTSFALFDSNTFSSELTNWNSIEPSFEQKNRNNEKLHIHTASVQFVYVSRHWHRRLIRSEAKPRANESILCWCSVSWLKWGKTLKTTVEYRYSSSKHRHLCCLCYLLLERTEYTKSFYIKSLNLHLNWLVFYCLCVCLWFEINVFSCKWKMVSALDHLKSWQCNWSDWRVSNSIKSSTSKGNCVCVCLCSITTFS